MSQTFFFGWQLWEKLTFILGIVIVIVFCIGWGKLLWMTRRSKRHALLDEEKRTKIEELRREGHTVTSRHDNGIPFGVRAIESGIEVDGIWVSRPNTPVPESLKSLQSSARSSTSSIKSNESSKEVSLGDDSPSSDAGFETSLDAFRQSRLSLGRIVAGEYLHPQEPETLSWRRTATYKPRRSSQLRYSSYADNNDGVLSQIEGSVALNSYEQTCCRNSSQRLGIVLDSSFETVAGNEHCSGGDSDRSLSSSEGNMESNQLIQGTESETGNQGISDDKARITHKSMWSKNSIILPSMSEDFTIPLESPSLPKPDRFSAPEVSPNTFSSASMKLTSNLPKTETGALGETQWPLLSERRDFQNSPVFMPGAIHCNKAHRAINTGFEVFPAGTFGKPNEIKELIEPSNLSVKGVSLQLNQEPKRERHSKKLKKIEHYSKTEKRMSMFVERF